MKYLYTFKWAKLFDYFVQQITEKSDKKQRANGI